MTDSGPAANGTYTVVIQPLESRWSQYALHVPVTVQKKLPPPPNPPVIESVIKPDHWGDGGVVVEGSSDPDGTSYAYTYDPAGNRLTMSRTGSDDPEFARYTYNAANELTNQILNDDGNVTVYDYGYDRNGNLIRKLADGDPDVNYTYDYENRLVEVLGHQGDKTTYVYDGDGNRLAKIFGTALRNQG